MLSQFLTGVVVLLGLGLISWVAWRVMSFAESEWLKVVGSLVIIAGLVWAAFCVYFSLTFEW